ncbi:MAG: tRNA uridine-5-carboxymethylaminomethyl(34) synthesis GTPase MnmE [Lysobacteraceae bacterium]
MPQPATDTIAAIATAAGAGGIGIVRLSGPAAHHIAGRLTGITPRPRQAHHARFRDADGEVIDSGLLLAFPAPNSYTGEDVVELHAHGSLPILAALLRRALALGARQARPGEFTERAFLNGKLDLAQAEAVADLIAAGSEAAARAATRSLDGAFSRQVETLRRDLVRLRVHVEAAIDFPEEEIDFLGDGQIAAALAALRQRHAELMQATRRGQRLRDGLHVVILGPPNAGKSSLLNALAGDERAIVTAIAGTTRDVLRETIRLDGIELSLVDTAGLRADSDDPVEREGIRRARREQSRADLVLAVSEAGDATAFAALQAELREAPGAVLWLHNKIDAHGQSAHRETRPDGEHLWLSARTGDGLPLLIDALKSAAGLHEDPTGAFSARTRHVALLEQVGDLLDQSAAQLAAGAGELLAEDLRQAHERLGEITGQVRSDDLLGEIFSSFCIGK